MKTILGVDSATENCSAALLHDGRYYIRQKVAPQQHTKLILPMIDEILHEAGIKKTDVQAIAYGHGPGSFTGVRIAASAVQGLSLGLNLKVQGISNLKAMAYKAYKMTGNKDALYVASIDARMSELYLGLYRADESGALYLLADECVLPKDKAAELIKEKAGDLPIICSGTGCQVLKNEEYLEIDKIIVDFPDACSIIELASMNIDGFTDAIEAQPVYIRNEVTWKKISQR